MSFTRAIATCFRNYVTFSGRASRPEYWWFFLFCFAGSIAAGILDGIVFGAAEVEMTGTSFRAESRGPIASLFSLAVLLPALAVGWRRMHDTGRSGLYVLYPLIATVGIFTFISFVGGMEILASGDPGQLFSGIVGLILIPAFIILAISPFLVLWWLSRPTQPEANQWGPPPAAARRSA